MASSHRKRIRSYNIPGPPRTRRKGDGLGLVQCTILRRRNQRAHSNGPLAVPGRLTADKSETPDSSHAFAVVLHRRLDRERAAKA
jgi:hypothetical protein